MYIKLSTWAKENNVTYRTAWNYYNNRVIKGKQLETGTILIENVEERQNNL